MKNFIESDIRNGMTYLKCAIMNTLSEIESGKTKMSLGKHIALSLIIKCAKERGWIEDPDMDFEDWTNGWQVNYFYYMITPDNKKVGIYGSLLQDYGTDLEIVKNEI